MNFAMKNLIPSMSALLLLACLMPGQRVHADEPRPPFSWDHVPVYAHVGKSSGDFTADQLDFLAEHFGFITVEKAQAVRKYGNTEDGFTAAVLGIKERNPDATVLFYWNGFLDVANYRARDDFPEGGHLLDRDGQPVLIRERVRTYDLSRADVRDWWSDVAATAVADGPADGIFIDALPKIPAGRNRRLLGEDRYAALNAGLAAMLRQTREKLGPGPLMVYNGMRNGAGTEHLPATDGAMIEHFGDFASGDKEKIAKDLESMREAALAGKIVILKAWPGFTFLDGSMMRRPHEELARLARERITFPLACFLVAAEPHCYFCYTWGYQEEHGTFDWYPEFDRPLGPPQGDAERTGWTYRREFAHASVIVDLEARTARIDWNP